MSKRNCRVLIDVNEEKGILVREIWCLGNKTYLGVASSPGSPRGLERRVHKVMVS